MTDATTAIAYYDAQRGRMAFLWDSYWGGDRYRNPSSTTIGTARLTRYQQRRDAEGKILDDIDEVDVCTYRTYLVPHPGEDRRAFAVRVALATYVNIPRTIVDAYVDAVVGPAARDLGTLAPYLANLNGRGRRWTEHVEDVARCIQVYGWTATLLDVPRVNPATNAAEEERLGIGLRASHVHPSAVAWIAVDRDGVMQEFAFVDVPYVAQDTAPTAYTARVYVYTTTEWAVFDVPMRASEPLSVARLRIAGGPRAKKPLEPLDRGAVATPGKVPVVLAFFTEDSSSPVPLGQGAIDDTCDVARAVYNTLSWIDEIHRLTAFPFLAIPEAAQGGDLDPDTKIQVGPSSALGYPSTTGAPSWVQPSAESTAELRTHALFLVMIAVSMAGLEVTLDGGSGNDASGRALELRNRRFNSTCTRLAKNLAAYEEAVFALAREILRKPDAVASVTYPTRFVLADASQLLAAVTLLLQTLGDRMGPEGITAAMRQAIGAALNLSDDELAVVVDEVRAKLEATTLPANAGRLPLDADGNPPKVDPSTGGDPGKPTDLGTG